MLSKFLEFHLIFFNVIETDFNFFNVAIFASSWPDYILWLVYEWHIIVLYHQGSNLK